MNPTTKSPYQVVVRPIVTEKTVMLSNERKYVFEVDGNANKFEIAWAVEQIQKDVKNTVNVIDVATVSVKGRKRIGRFFRRASRGRSSDWKKAIVTLAVGQQIDLVEGV